MAPVPTEAEIDAMNKKELETYLILMVEGYATGASVHQASRYSKA